MTYDLTELRAQLESGSLTCDLSDLSDDVGVLPGSFAWRSTIVGFVGPAHTIHAPEGDLEAVYEGIRAAEAGSVIVVATGGVTCAIWGETTTRLALARGVVGAVLDGFCRDIKAVKALGFAVVSRGISPKRAARLNRGTIGQTVAVGGITVHARDLIVSDENGIVVVPKFCSAKLYDKYPRYYLTKTL